MLSTAIYVSVMLGATFMDTTLVNEEIDQTVDISLGADVHFGNENIIELSNNITVFLDGYVKSSTVVFSVHDNIGVEINAEVPKNTFIEQSAFDNIQIKTGGYLRVKDIDIERTDKVETELWATLGDELILSNGLVGFFKPLGSERLYKLFGVFNNEVVIGSYKDVLHGHHDMAYLYTGAEVYGGEYIKDILFNQVEAYYGASRIYGKKVIVKQDITNSISLSMGSEIIPPHSPQIDLENVVGLTMSLDFGYKDAITITKTPQDINVYLSTTIIALMGLAEPADMLNIYESAVTIVYDIKLEEYFEVISKLGVTVLPNEYAESTNSVSAYYNAEVISQNIKETFIDVVEDLIDTKGLMFGNAQKVEMENIISISVGTAEVTPSIPVVFYNIEDIYLNMDTIALENQYITNEDELLVFMDTTGIKASTKIFVSDEPNIMSYMDVNLAKVVYNFEDREQNINVLLGATIQTNILIPKEDEINYYLETDIIESPDIEEDLEQVIGILLSTDYIYQEAVTITKSPQEINIYLGADIQPNMHSSSEDVVNIVMFAEGIKSGKTPKLDLDDAISTFIGLDYNLQNPITEELIQEIDTFFGAELSTHLLVDTETTIDAIFGATITTQDVNIDVEEVITLLIGTDLIIGDDVYISKSPQEVHTIMGASLYANQTVAPSYDINTYMSAEDIKNVIAPNVEQTHLITIEAATTIIVIEPVSLEQEQNIQVLAQTIVAPNQYTALVNSATVLTDSDVHVQDIKEDFEQTIGVLVSSDIIIGDDVYISKSPQEIHLYMAASIYVNQFFSLEQTVLTNINSVVFVKDNHPDVINNIDVLLDTSTKYGKTNTVTNTNNIFGFIGTLISASQVTEKAHSINLTIGATVLVKDTYENKEQIIGLIVWTDNPVGTLPTTTSTTHDLYTYMGTSVWKNQYPTQAHTINTFMGLSSVYSKTPVFSSTYVINTYLNTLVRPEQVIAPAQTVSAFIAQSSLVGKTNINNVSHNISTDMGTTCIAHQHIDVTQSVNTFVGQANTIGKRVSTEMVNTIGLNLSTDYAYGNDVTISKTHTIGSAISATFFYNAGRFEVPSQDIDTKMGTQATIKLPFNLTLNKQSGSGGTSTIQVVHTHQITPSSVIMPTRTDLHISGYYTTTFISENQTWKATVPASGTNRRVTFEDNNSNGAPTLFLQNLYANSTSWRIHAVVRSTAPVTHFDISDQSANAYVTNLSKGSDYIYIIDAPLTSAMANYTYATYHYEFMDLSTTTDATVTLTDTWAYVNATALTKRIDSQGNFINLDENTYSAATTLYANWAWTKVKVVWKNYAGTILKTEWILKSGYSAVTPATSTAPTGTADTAEWAYSWPVGSYSIPTGATHESTYTITETRTKKSYTITWYGMNTSGTATGPYTTTVNYGVTPTPHASSTSVPSADAQYTYTSKGFNTSNTGFNGATITIPAVTGAATYYHILTRTVRSYTITWKDWDNTTLKTESVNYGSTPTPPSTPTRTQSDYFTYAFNAWSPSVVAVTGAATYTATYTDTPRVYTVTYNLNGGSASGLPTTWTSFALITTARSLTLATPTRTGYTFTGWTFSNAGTFDSGGTPYTPTINGNTVTLAQAGNPPKSGYGNLAFVANWSLVTYTLTLTKGTGISAATITPTTYNITTTTFTPSVSGVSYEAGYGNYSVSPALASIAKGSTGNKTYTISATKTNYTITRDANGGSGGTTPSPATYQIAGSMQSSTFTIPTRTGYQISSWTVSGQTAGTPTVSVSGTTATITIPAYTYGNFTVKANWSLVTYTLTKGSIPTGVATFVVQRTSSPIGGGSIAALNNGATLYHNDVLSFTATASNGYNTPTRTPASNVTVTSNVSASVTAGSLITYTLTHDRNGGSGGNNSANYNITTASTIGTLLGTATRTGYTRTNYTWTSTTAGGWTNNSTYATSLSVSGKYASGTLKANWTANTYTVTFNKNGGNTPSPASKTVTYASTYGALATVTHPSGYTFKGWFTQASGGTQISTGTTVTTASNHTLYAQWEANKTTAPTLHSQTIGQGFFQQIQVRARNVDSAGSATILMDSSSNPPTTSRGSIAYNSYTSWVTVTQPGVGVTVYATAQVSGKNKSNVTSVYLA